MDSGLSRQTRRSEAPRQAVASAIAWPGAAWLRTRSAGRGPRFGAHTPGGGESARGRSEGCGREKCSRTSRDGLDETPDKTQRQKHRGQTDRSLRLAARRPRRSDKGQAKTVGASGEKRDSQQRKWMRAASKHRERCPPREQRPRDRAGPLPPHPATRLPLPPAPGASAEAKPAHRLGGVPLNTRGHSVTARGQDQNTTAPRSHL